MNKDQRKPRGTIFGAVKNYYSDLAEKEDVQNGDTSSLPVGKEQVQKAQEELRRYKSGKQNLEARIIEDELWYKRRHWTL